MNTLDTQQNDIMNSFDFDKVLKVMHAMDWTWQGQVVTLDRLKSTSHYLLDRVILDYKRRNKWCACATGGFKARIDVLANGAPRLTLSFIIEETTGRYNSF
jgi:hypothetical protein